MTSPKTQTGSTVADLTNDSPLADRIRATAHKLAYRYGAHADDVQSEITLAILERYYEDPDFLTDNTIAYVVSHGAWRARDVLKRECTLFVNRTIDGDAEIGDDGAATLLELLPGEGWDEVEFGLSVELAMDELGAENAQIARMYAAGYSSSEISSEVGVARRTVYYRLNHPVRDALEAQGFAQSAA